VIEIPEVRGLHHPSAFTVPSSTAVIADHDLGTKVYQSFRQLRTVLMFVGTLCHVLDPILATYPLMQ
jgi:hypothetical protein